MIDTIEEIEEEIRTVIPLSPEAETSPPPPPPKKDFKLIPLYKTKAILNSWGYYIEGIECVLGYAGGDTNLAKIYNDILSGELLLWIGLSDGNYCGFVTTRFDQTPLGDKTLLVSHCFIKLKTNPNLFMDGLNEIEKFAKEFNCNAVKFFTKREDAFDRRLGGHGYKKEYTVFVKSLKENEK